MVAQRIASRLGLSVPAAKGATVKGTRAADINLRLLLEIHCIRILCIRTFRTSNGNCHALERVWGLARDRWLRWGQLLAIESSLKRIPVPSMTSLRAVSFICTQWHMIGI